MTHPPPIVITGLHEKPDWLNRVSRGNSIYPCTGSRVECGFACYCGGSVEPASHEIPAQEIAAQRTIRRCARIAGLLKLISLLGILNAAVLAGNALSISAIDAKGHVGDRATVCGRVANEHLAAGSRGQPLFINLDSPYPSQVFTILIWGEDRPNVGQLPRRGERICATGLIQDYHGVPQIVVRSSGQLTR